MAFADLFKKPQATTPTNTNGDNNKPFPTEEQRNPDGTIKDTSKDDKTKDGKLPGGKDSIENPLDIYKQMWEDAGKGSTIKAPEFKLDAEAVGKVASNMDFTKGLDAELLTKATGGDVNSLLEIIKKVGQNSYRAAIEHSSSLTDTFISKRSDYERSQINDGVREQLTTSALANTPNFSHPVIKQELTRIAKGFASANPDASPQEVADLAKKYMTDLHTAMNPTDPNAKTNKDGTKASDVMDWDKYLTGQ